MTKTIKKGLPRKIITKKRVLWWSDSPTATTGFGNVARNIINQLLKTGEYEITVVGIAHYGDPYDHSKFPYDIYPAQAFGRRDNDVYGRAKVIELILSNNFDIVFFLQDTFVLQTFMKDILAAQSQKEKDGHRFNLIYYYPIDCTPKKEWIRDSVAPVDFPVAYTKYGYDMSIMAHPELAKNPNFKFIYHGTDKEVFFPAPKLIVDKWKSVYFGEKFQDKFIVLSVNMNQPRKDIIRSFEGFSIFHKKHPESYFYMLAQPIAVGGNLMEMAEQLGLRYGVDWCCPLPGSYQSGKGLSEQHLNLLYNSADVFISTSLGEGWGLTVTEAMACEVPVIVPNNTSLLEIIGLQERGHFIRSGEPGHSVFLGNIDNNRVRPSCDSVHLAKLLEETFFNGKDEEILKKAREWLPSWEEVGQEWLEIFKKASVGLEKKID